MTLSPAPRSNAARRWRVRSSASRLGAPGPRGVLDLLCAALCTGAALLALSGALAKQLWAADVISLFRPYALLASAAVFLTCLAARRSRFALLALLLVVLEAGLLAAPSLRGDAHPHGGHGGRPLTVITFNCLGSNPNSRTAVAWIRKMRPDVLVLEELPSGWARELDTLADVLPYRASQLQGAPSDTDVFSRSAIRSAEAYRPAPDLRTLIHAVVLIGGRPVQVFGIHPNTLQTPQEWINRNNALELSAQWVRQTRGRDATLVLGDWNTPPWSPYFHAFLALAGLKGVDGVLWPPVTRVLGAPLGLRIGSSIDHVAASRDIDVDGCDTGPDLGSDHVPQICRLRLGPAT